MTPQRPDGERPIAALLVPDILDWLDEDPASIPAETEEMHAADLADVVEALPRERVAALLAALPAERAADVLEYLDDDLRTEVLEAMRPRDAAALVTEMTPDDRTDALEDLEDDVAEEIVSAMPAEARRETEQLLSYDPYTAGGLMTTEFVAIESACTVEDALLRVRALARAGRREAMYSIYVTDRQGRLAGVLSLRELLAAPEGAKVDDIAWTEVQTVRPSAEQEAVARLTSEYDLVAVPVVDERGIILGVVTVDDVIDAIQEEQTEDVQKLGGMEALDEPYMQIGILGMIRKRVGWLSVLFVGSLLTATAIDHFQGMLSKADVLISFIPMIISSGGNSGSQATSLIIRAMALDEISLRDWWHVAGREIRSGLLLGIIVGFLGLVRVLLWHWAGWGHYPYPFHVGLTIAGSLLGVVTFGSMCGSMLPFLLRRLGLDPASASAPFVATLVDVTGLVIYFTVALLILRGTLL